jgi:hypothetical protein
MAYWRRTVLTCLACTLCELAAQNPESFSVGSLSLNESLSHLTARWPPLKLVLNGGRFNKDPRVILQADVRPFADGGTLHPAEEWMYEVCSRAY